MSKDHHFCVKRHIDLMDEPGAKGTNPLPPKTDLIKASSNNLCYSYDRRRFRVLMGAAALEGATIGPFIDLAIKIDPSAFVRCAIAFGCFLAAAIYAKRGEFMYLGGFLSSSISILFWMAIASSLFGGSTTVFLFQLYFGLLVFLGYVIYDTQSIVERAHLGVLDYVNHAMTLFSDFISVFVRILIIMSHGMIHIVQDS